MVQPLLPAPKPRRFRYPGRKRVDDRKALTGILFVLKSGIPWEMLPQEMDCGSGMTCWRRLQEWQAAGVWPRLHETPLSRLQGAHGLDWSRACVDSGLVRAVGDGEKNGPNPTDRGKPGSKHHLLTDANGTPLSAILTGANRHDATHCPWWMQCRRCGGSAADPAAVQSGSTPTGPMTPGSIARTCAPPHRARLGSAGDRARQRAGGAPVGGGTNPVLAAPVSPTAGTLRAACRHP